MVPNNLNTEAFKNLTPQEQKVALEILKQYSDTGHSTLFDDLKYADFDEIPVNISTFMHDKKYLGNALYDAEGRFTVYPYWEKCLEDIFPDNLTTKYNNIVFTGAIGLGKSTIAVIILLYMLYRLLCLKDPYAYYGMQPIDKITISLMNITIENAKGVALDKMNQMILSSDWFMAHGEISGVTNLVYRPEKHIEIIVASSNNQIIGRALFCLDGQTKIETSEGTFTLEELKDKQIKVVSIDENGNKVLSDFCTVKPTIATVEEYQIELEDGTIIKCTGNHKLMLKDGTYKEAQLLTEEDELMDVQISYNDFINNIIKERGQWSLDAQYEGHHIIPKCFGGDGNTKSKHPNIIRLTPKEHYIAHKLLALEHPDCRALVNAWEMMAYPKGKTKRDYFVSADDYEILRKLWSEHMSKDNPGLCNNGHPWNYGTGIKHEKKFIFVNNGQINKKIKETDEIPEGFVVGRIKPKPKQLLTPAQHYEIYSKLVTGERNPMYGKGYKVANGNNGHAITRYFINNLTFESGKELIEYLHKFDEKISNSTIRKLKSGSARVLREHPILKELNWEAK